MVMLFLQDNVDGAVPGKTALLFSVFPQENVRAQ